MKSQRKIKLIIGLAVIVVISLFALTVFQLVKIYKTNQKIEQQNKQIEQLANQLEYYKNKYSDSGYEIEQ